MKLAVGSKGKIWIGISAVLFFSVNNANARPTTTVASTTTTVASTTTTTAVAGAFVQNGNSFGTLATLGTNDNNTLAFETNSIERLRINASGNVGVGTADPNGKLHVSQAIPDPAGIVFALPSFFGFPDSSYIPKESMRWEGGESKFGKWRQYFNQKEQSWALTYNAPYDVQANTFGPGRDSGNALANISAHMAFDVAEGNSGLNAFQIDFAPPGSTTDSPNFIAASNYKFFDGRIGVPGFSLIDAPSMPALLAISGASNMDAILSLSSNSTVDPNIVDLVSDGSNPGVTRGTQLATPKLFKIRNRLTGADLMLVKTDTGNVGIGMQASTSLPSAKLQVGNGDVYTSTAGNGYVAKSPDGTRCARIGIDNSGNITTTSVTCP